MTNTKARRVRGCSLALGILVTCCRVAAPSDIVGRWSLVDDSGAATGKAVLSFAPDGVLVATDAPADWLYDSGVGRAKPVTGKARWKLIKDGPEQTVECVFEQIVSGGQGSTPYRAALRLARQGSGYVLYYSLGDPDEGRRRTFVRIE